MSATAKSSMLATLSLALIIAAGSFFVLAVVSWFVGLVPNIAYSWLELASHWAQTFVLAVALAVIALVVSIISKTRHPGERRSTIAMSTSIAGSAVGVPIVAIALVVGSLLGTFHENVAETQGRHAVQTYTSSGASILCENGNNGYGMDNTEPWYVVYLDAPKSLGTRNIARRALRSAGVAVPVSHEATTPDHQEPPSSTFAVASADRRVDITVARVGAVPKYCGGWIDYNRGNDVKPGRVLVAVQVVYPSRYSHGSESADECGQCG